MDFLGRGKKISFSGTTSWLRGSGACALAIQDVRYFKIAHILTMLEQKSGEINFAPGGLTLQETPQRGLACGDGETTNGAICAALEIIDKMALTHLCWQVEPMATTQANMMP